jgi:hypothetical protein
MEPTRPFPEELAQKLEALSRQNRRVRLVAWLAFALAVVLGANLAWMKLIAGQSGATLHQPTVMERISILGCPSIIVAGPEYGRPSVDGIHVWGRASASDLRLSMGCREEGPVIYLKDKESRPRLELAVVGDEPRIVFYDSAGTPTRVIGP